MDSLSRDIQPVETALANMVDLIKSLDKGKNIEKKDLATVLEELKSTYCEIVGGAKASSIVLNDPDNLECSLEDLEDKIAKTLEEDMYTAEKFDFMSRDALKNYEVRADAGTSGNNGSDSDDEEEVISVNYVNKDPMTKQPIKNPVKNKFCGHVYDRDVIESFINAQTQKKMLRQCPVGGCANKKNLQMKELISFPQFFDLVDKRK